jgi:serine/threonine-protein kinase HipA
MIVRLADVYKAGVFAGQIIGRDDSNLFQYSADYLKSGQPAIASTLPLSDAPVVTTSGAVPAYFAGLLPEGRRLSALIRRVKTSADDELSLVAAVGSNTIGDVQVFDTGVKPTHVEPVVLLTKDLQVESFAGLLEESFGTELIAIPGVQDKVSGRMITVSAKAATDSFILKFDPPEFPQLVENEHFFLTLAKQSGLNVVEHQLVTDSTGKKALAVTRFDRQGIGGLEKSLAVEDACQALGLWPVAKYDPSSERAVGALIKLCSAGGLEAAALFGQLLFAWVTGNGDAHTKNLSVLARDTEYRVSPAYDLPSTLFYSFSSAMALSVMGRKTGISGKIWLTFAEEIGVPHSIATKMARQILSATAGLEEQIAEGFLNFDQQTCKKAAREIKNRRRLTLEGWPDIGLN